MLDAYCNTGTPALSPTLPCGLDAFKYMYHDQYVHLEFHLDVKIAIAIEMPISPTGLRHFSPTQAKRKGFLYAMHAKPLASCQYYFFVGQPFFLRFSMISEGKSKSVGWVIIVHTKESKMVCLLLFVIPTGSVSPFKSCFFSEPVQLQGSWESRINLLHYKTPCDQRESLYYYIYNR